MIPYSASLEAKLMEMDEQAKTAFCEENKCKSMMDSIVVRCPCLTSPCNTPACHCRRPVAAAGVRVSRAAADSLLHVRP